MVVHIYMGAGQERLGIYIKSVVKGGAADADGRLQAGDQLLKVDGQSLVGITQEKAAEYLVRTGPVVALEVAKQGAIYHGLATLLSQPSPVMGRASVPPPARLRPQSELYPPVDASLLSAPRSTSMQQLVVAAGGMTRYPPRNVLQPQLPPAHQYEWAQPVTTISGPRRMSERDLPNRILTEQNHNPVEQRRSLPPPHVPAMTSSKSVPALNSNHGDMHPVVQPASAGKPPQEVFNPGYSRTSSTNSIPQKAFADAGHQSPNTGGLRSRSSHNLHDGVHGMPPLPPHAGQTVVSRQASTPVLPGQQQAAPQAQQPESERFYQNLSVYRSSAGHPEHPPGQVNGYPAAPPSPSRGKLPSPHDDRLMGQQMPPQQQQQPHPMKSGPRAGSQSSLQRPAETMMNAATMRDRPASAYIPQKDGYGPQHPHGMVPGGASSVPRSQSSRDMLRQEAKLHEMQEEVRRREARGAPPINSPNGLYYPPPPGQHPPNLQHARSHPQLPPQSMQQPHPSPQQQHPQMRPSNTFPPPSGYPEGYPQQMGYPPSGRHPNAIQPAGAPPTAPKPRGPGYIDTPPGRPPPPDDMYRESPPPPPPPTSTHPLYQPGQGKPNQPADNRYAASMGEPPRGAYLPTNSGRPPQQPYGGTNPWDREEREKEQLRRREAARQWRDQQISELEALQGSRTAQQEEQLRALRLEREFQRRAEEALEDDEDETSPQDENGERPQGLLMRSNVISPEEALRQQQFQQHMQKARLIQSNGDMAPRPQASPAMSVTDSSPAGQYPRHPQDQPQYGRQMEERERQRKLEEMRRKQMELEAAREAEERILREAQKKREEDLRQQRELQLQREQQFLMQQQQMQQQQQQAAQQHYHAQHPAPSPSYHGQSPAAVSPSQRTNHLHPGAVTAQYKPPMNPATAPLRLEGLNSNTMHYNGHSTSTNGPYSPHDDSAGSTPTGTQRLDTLLHSNGAPASPSTPVNSVPPPPERGSSFAIMSQQQPGGVLRNSGSAPRSEPKRVSFHDPKASPPEMNNHVDRPREDPNNFINEAQTLLATPRSPDGSFTGNTPGVIGAQEVYKDPRMRRLAEQQHQKLLQTRVGPGPEKLSFKEKMKMFAMETGEDGTPKDKVKISRAQRDIEEVPGQPNLNNNSLTAADDRNH